MSIPPETIETNFIEALPTTTVRQLLDLAAGRPSRNWTWVVVAMAGGQYAVTRISDIAQAAADGPGAAILDTALADIPDLLHGGPAVDAGAGRTQAMTLAQANPGQCIPVLDAGQVVGVLDVGPRRLAKLALDLWELAAGDGRFHWPYDDLQLSDNLVVLDPGAPAADLARRLAASATGWTYLVLAGEGTACRVMMVNTALLQALDRLPRGAQRLPLALLPGLPRPAPGLEEGSVPWSMALDRVRRAPDRCLVILRDGRPAGVLAEPQRGTPQASEWIAAWPMPQAAMDGPSEPMTPPTDFESYTPPEPPPPPPPSGPPSIVRRYSDVAFPRNTVVDVPVDLTVGLTAAPKRPGATGLDFRPPRADQPFDVDLYLLFSEDDFALDGDFHRRLTVPPGGDSNYETFRLTPLAEGPKQLTLEFHNSGSYVGATTIKTTVGPTGQPADLAGPPETCVTGGTLAFGGQAPDITLTIVEVQTEGARRKYRYQVLTPHPELKPDPANLADPDDWAFSLDSPESYVKLLIEDLNTWARSKSGDVAAYQAEIEAKGSFLYEKLFPRGLKDWYWAKIDPRLQQGTSTSLLIVSSEPWIPWELVRPAEPGRTGRFLCEAFIFGRWIVPEPAPRDRLDLERLGLVVPPSDLQNAPAEVQSIQDLLGTVVHNIPSGLLDVLSAFKAHDYDGLHIVGHGRYRPDVPELSIVPLTGGDLTPDLIVGENKTLFAEQHPLVFLNACEVARQGVALNGLGGWAPALIDAGASAFLGSTWRVTDTLAAQFAAVFYQALRDGSTAGQAVQAARSAIRNPDSTDPSWLGYALYGHPLAKVHFPQSG